MKVVHALLLFVALTGEATCQLIRKYVFVGNALTWVDAQAYCRNYYEDLSTINSREELNAFIKDGAFYLAAESWIGLRRNLTTDMFQWSDGSTLEFTAWNPGDPKRATHFLCGYAYNTGFGLDNCAYLLPFFCYKWVPQMVLVKMMMTWNDALQYCRTYYSELISVITDKDLQVAKSTSMTSQTLNVWTGLRFIDGSWFWVNQNPLENLTSVPSCPMSPFRCGALKAGDDVWENRDCNEKMNFLCSS